jgi:hypothetical protein
MRQSKKPHPGKDFYVPSLAAAAVCDINLHEQPSALRAAAGQPQRILGHQGHKKQGARLHSPLPDAIVVATPRPSLASLSRLLVPAPPPAPAVARARARAQRLHSFPSPSGHSISSCVSLRAQSRFPCVCVISRFVLFWLLRLGPRFRVRSTGGEF